MFAPLCAWVSGVLLCSALSQPGYLPGYGSMQYYNALYGGSVVVPLPPVCSLLNNC